MFPSVGAVFFGISPEHSQWQTDSRNIVCQMSEFESETLEDLGEKLEASRGSCKHVVVEGGGRDETGPRLNRRVLCDKMSKSDLIQTLP